MFTFSGTLTRHEYFRQLAFAYAVFVVFTVAIVALTRYLDAEGFDVTILLALLIALSALWLIYILSLIIRRARDTGNIVHWTAASFLLPVIGMIAVGCVPSAHKHVVSTNK